MLKTIGLVLFIAHMIGCNSMVFGYMVGANSSDKREIIRQLQVYNK
jgi:hypothetical protein